MAVTIDAGKCEMCGACVDACTTDALTEVKPAGETGHIEVDPDLCAGLRGMFAGVQAGGDFAGRLSITRPERRRYVVASVLSGRGDFSG